MKEFSLLPIEIYEKGLIVEDKEFNFEFRWNSYIQNYLFSLFLVEPQGKKNLILSKPVQNDIDFLRNFDLLDGKIGFKKRYPFSQNFYKDLDDFVGKISLVYLEKNETF